MGHATTNCISVPQNAEALKRPQLAVGPLEARRGIYGTAICHLSKFSLTATQAILYFDGVAPGDTVKVKFRLRARYPIRVRTFQSRV